MKTDGASANPLGLQPRTLGSIGALRRCGIDPLHGPFGLRRILEDALLRIRRAVSEIALAKCSRALGREEEETQS